MVLTTTTSLFFLFFCGLFALVGLGWRLLRRPSPFTRTSKVNIPDKPAYMRDLIQLSRHNEPASTLLHLISVDGAGDWPPRCDHDSWPQALLPYQQIYLELNSLLPHAQVSTDDQVNQNHRQIYRSLMRRFLAERVDVQKVTRLMAAAEAGNWEELSLAAYNGFYCAVAVSRHAYR